jgi:glycosyltransferase involved in cell wall biosynthesis
MEIAQMKQGRETRTTRVLYLVTSSLSAVLLRGQLRYLSQRDFEVSLASSPGENLTAICQEERVQPIAVAMAREISPLKDFFAFFRLCALMRRLHPYLTNVSTPKAGLLGGLAAFVTRVPCRVYTLRGLRWETASGLKQRVLLLAEWIACHSAHRVICVSHSVREKAIAAGSVPQSRAVVLGNGSSNGVDAERFKPTEESRQRGLELRREFAIPPDALVVGYAGRLTRDKGIPELYEAHKVLRMEFPSLRLLLLGDFEDGDPLPDAVKQSLRTDPSVVRPGFVANMCDFHQSFDVLALPSHREGFPNVILEASAAGKPVISTHATGTSDAVIDGVTGILVPVADVNALVAGLRTLFSDAALRAKMGAAGRERVIKDFSPERIWNAVAEEYLGLLQAKGLPLPGLMTACSGTVKEAPSNVQ